MPYVEWATALKRLHELEILGRLGNGSETQVREPPAWGQRGKEDGL
jgi:hypothetical protein